MPQFRISEHYYEKRYKSPDPTCQIGKKGFERRNKKEGALPRRAPSGFDI
jgi:hypothetical protein